MGRKLKRVALDFDYPLNKTWEGYICPHNGTCPDCNGRGRTPAMQALAEHTQNLMWSRNPLLAPITEGLAGRSASGPIGHDSIDEWVAREKIVAAAGLPEGWGTCPACEGHGTPADIRALQEAWEPTEPPEGPGYQIWQTVSEGGPISPVFATPEELARWMSTPGNGWNDKGTTYETWLKFIIGPGWAPSFAGSAAGIQSGVEFVTSREGK